MKRSKFTEAQIAFILRQGDEGTPVGEVCRKAGFRHGSKREEVELSISGPLLAPKRSSERTCRVVAFVPETDIDQLRVTAL